ncbi:Alpha-1A adrenergic receptor [Stylophora pistillata]|uniref:Alpha-1A adrenergic receptor n=1 Tax=Stylophora pistillata TaxID=50429 RepID=A0A2B4S5R5_STYPI|nr:Alpha-1A adrenergic receptor [Stylophora pistillata]
MNSTNCKPNAPGEEPPDIIIPKIFIVILVILIIAITFGNSLLFMAFHKFSSLRSASNSILMSLCAADSLTVVVFALDISLLAHKPKGTNPDSDARSLMCTFSGVSTILLISVITVHLAFISVERFIAVKFALRYQSIVTTRRTMLTSLVVWLWAIAVAVVLPHSALDGKIFKELYHALHPCSACSREKRKTMPPAALGYVIFWVISVLVIPILIILCSYGYIYLISRKHRREIEDQVNIQGAATTWEEMKGARTVAIVHINKSSCENSEQTLLLSGNRNVSYYNL